VAAYDDVRRHLDPAEAAGAAFDITAIVSAPSHFDVLGYDNKDICSIYEVSLERSGSIRSTSMSRNAIHQVKDGMLTSRFVELSQKS